MVSLLLVTACAGLPGDREHCGGVPTSAAIAIEPSQTDMAQGADCSSWLIAGRFQTVGGVSQRGSQTRTVGVPREFLVAMIVLLLIFGLA